jgi:hypothetical protein
MGVALADVLSCLCATYHPARCVLHQLKPVYEVVWHAIEETVAIVQL